MCGIAGIHSTHGSSSDRTAAVHRMVNSIRHRGPDEVGFAGAGPLAFGMARLSIIDVAGGHQPIWTEDRQVAVACNGEIYNHETWRETLSLGGHRFSTRSDVEIIAHLYEEYGDGCFSRLEGMFAAAVWDERQGRLLLARDRLGIKPLFYSVAPGELQFGSELKVFRQSIPSSLTLDPEALDLYLTLGYVPSPFTIYKEVRKLPPGHVLCWDGTRATIKAYWTLPAASPAHASASLEELETSLLALLRAAVRSQLMSEVPLGAFLSGGIDSSLIVALMAAESATPVHTFTLGFQGQNEGYLDERPYARQVSEKFGTIHTELEVAPRFEDALDEIVGAFDEPFADDSVIPTFYISKLARRHVTVALTGLGGDELFGGYERYLGIDVSAKYQKLPALLRAGVLAPLAERLPDRDIGFFRTNRLKRFVRADSDSAQDRYFGYLAVMSPALKEQLYATGSGLNQRSIRGLHSDGGDWMADPLDAALRYDLGTYLPDDVLALTDRLSMHHGLELRVPFLDEGVVAFAAGLGSNMKIRRGTKKYLLRRVAATLLPAAILNHRKQGFASPMSQWLRGGQQGFIASALAPDRLALHGLFDAGVVQSMIRAHVERRESYHRQLFTLLMFQRWFERFGA